MFHEKQRISLIVYIIVNFLLLVFLLLNSFLKGSLTEDIDFYIPIILLVNIVLGIIKYDVELNRQEIRYRLFPIHFKHKIIPLEDIKDLRPVSFNPIGDLGGYGLRFNSKFGWVYYLRGNSGIKIIKKNGKKLTLGVKNTSSFINAIDPDT